MQRIVSKHKRTFLFLLIADLFILVLHLSFGKNSQFFHLDFENNLPTIYQSAKLLFFGLIFTLAVIWGKVKKDLKTFLLPLAIFLTFLGFDEFFQIHENIYRIFEFLPWLHPSKIVDASMKLGYKSSLWILYYLPLIFIFVFWSGYWLHYFQDKLKSNFWIIALSSLAFFAVLITEVLSSTGTYSEQTYFLMVSFEESAEMLLGSTLALVGLKVLDK